MPTFFLVLFALFVYPSAVFAGIWDLSGSVHAELRTFPEEPQFRDQFDHFQASLAINPEFRYTSSNEKHQFSFIPFARIDSEDNDRSHFDIREAYWRGITGDWEFLVGINSVFWGVTESRHLVNIINQIDQLEDIDEEDFLGQPMVKVATQRDWGQLSLFILPGFRERPFPDIDGRLRAPLPVIDEASEYESGAEEWHVDTAVRYSHFIGDWDLGLSYFYGTSREPRLIMKSNPNRLVPFYDLIHQWGLDVQYTREAWLFKFEGIIRDGQGDTFVAFVGGVEYTFYQILESPKDLGVLVELLIDDREMDKAPQTPMDNDLFFGSRLAFNDVQDTSALIGGVVDLEDGSTGLSLEAERRIGQHFKFELETRWFLNIDSDNVLAPFEKDDFINLRFSFFY